jgi:hypothetical protein
VMLVPPELAVRITANLTQSARPDAPQIPDRQPRHYAVWAKAARLLRSGRSRAATGPTASTLCYELPAAREPRVRV